jgi:hypothetical protein
VVEVNFGRDFGNRYGAGLIAEQIMYSERLYDTHTILVRNYLSSKYGAPADGLERYTQDELYNEEVAGIGQVTEYDKHLDAQGRGIIRMSEPSDIDDGEFLLWGTGNGDLEWAWGDDVFLSGRIARTWGYEETGDVGSVLVQVYDETGFLDNGVQPGIVYLANPTFVLGLTPSFVPLTNDGGVWSANLDFTGVGVFTIGVQPVVNITEENKADFLVYPNPASNKISIDFLGLAIEEVEIYDNQGKMVVSQKTEKGFAQIDISNLSSGFYLISALDSEGSLFSEKLEVIKE